MDGTFWEACAAGDGKAVRAALAGDIAWANRLDERGMPPLVHATFSPRLRDPASAAAVRDCVRVLLDAGADPNGSWTNECGPLSALYGAAGMHHDPPLTEVLLAAGATPNDNESLYHSLETGDDHCLLLLLRAGAVITGTNAFFHLLDWERPDRVRLFLDHGADPNEGSAHLKGPLYHALRRGRSDEVIRLLLDAGAAVTGDAYRLAVRLGRAGVVDEFRARGVEFPLGPEERFVFACAAADEAGARAQLAEDPDLIHRLTGEQLRVLPALAAIGESAGVRVMVELGWPIGVPGGDWHASALNLAVFRGDAGLTRFLLSHGAHWTERHGYDSDVRGTLAWASKARPVPDGDWVGCARALREAGMEIPPPELTYSPEVEAALGRTPRPQ